MTTVPHHPTHLVNSASAVEEAYDRVLPRMLELSHGDIAGVHTDVGNAVRVALASIERVEALRDELEELPGFDIANLDDLRDLAYATYHANAAATNTVADPVPEIAEEATKLRTYLSSAARALADAELLQHSRIDEISLGRSYLDLASDLQSLRRLFGDSATAVEGKTAVTSADLERAGTLGPALLHALANRDAKVREAPSSGELRARAFTLLRDAYDQVRRGVHFVRWDAGDADALAPSFHSTLTRRRRRQPTVEAAATVTASVVPAAATARAPSIA